MVRGQTFMVNEVVAERGSRLWTGWLASSHVSRLIEEPRLMIDGGHGENNVECRGMANRD